MNAPPEYCSIDTVAKHLDCSPSTVRDYANRGLLPQPYKKGSLIRWKWSEVDAAWSQSDAATTEQADPILRAINGT